ncbi:MAG: leucine-rich repeat domain-containing protein [Alphaproteobacteria bacterium]|nr:leucine-rich repeat domain-containing protein [Alphaproteobacteria bacterium]
MKKQFLMLSMASAALTLPLIAEAQTWDCSRDDAPNTCTATLDSTGKMTISGPGLMKHYSEGGAPWYSVRSSIKSVEIQEGITNVGNASFYGASNLESVTLPSTVKGYMGSGAFKNCNKLQSISLPETVNYIGGSAFFGMSGLRGELVIPESVWRIANYAFADASGISGKLIIPDSVTTIYEYAFRNLSNVTSLVVGESVSTLGSEVFNNMSGVETLFCPSTISCSGKGINNSKIKTYTKDENGVYKVGDVYYASAEDMANVVDGHLASIACSDYDSCVIAAAAYKDNKAAAMAERGVLCQTKTGCLKLMDMVSNPDLQCNASTPNTLYDCMNYAIANNISLNDPDPVTNNQSGNGGGQSSLSGKRIYTVEEAKQAVEAAGTETVNFRIRYK